MAQADLPVIAAAVRQVEVKTSAEVVPLIVRRSAVTSHVFPLLLLSFSTVALILEAILAGGFGMAIPLFWLIPEAAFLVLVAQWLSRRSWVQRVLTARADLDHQVATRAQVEFYQSGIHKTVDSTGILLMVSLVERQAVVLADSKVACQLPPETWAEVVQLMTKAMHEGAFAQGLVRAIERCGDLLAPLFPREDHDRNELPDAVMIKE